jgi:hypothetical protein
MEAPTRASQLRRRWSPLWTSLAALGLFTVALACIPRSPSTTNLQVRAIPVRSCTGAAAGGRRHLAMAAPGHRLGKVARVVILAGLALSPWATRRRPRLPSHNRTPRR